MKLSPPASSSDIDVARGIARRLARLARSGEAKEVPMPPFVPHLAARGAEHAPPPPRPAPPALPTEPPRPTASPRPAPEPRKPAPLPLPPPAEVPRAAAPPRPFAPKEPPRPAPQAPPVAEARKPPLPPPPPPEEDIGIFTEEEPLGVVTDDEPLGVVEDPPVRRFEPDPEIELEPAGDDLLPPSSDPPELDFDEPTEGKSASEPDLELVTDFEEEKPAPPSWPDILQDCLFLARAKGALLINPEGKVSAFCGDWPSPGVEAIALRLVPAMEKALKSAPTRSVSVPLGTQHLTAWRVPLSTGLVTVGFVADAPLKPEVRPTIDAELKRGVPA